jgi:hypothetical protein
MNDGRNKIKPTQDHNSQYKIIYPIRELGFGVPDLVIVVSWLERDFPEWFTAKTMAQARSGVWLVYYVVLEAACKAFNQ